MPKQRPHINKPGRFDGRCACDWCADEWERRMCAAMSVPPARVEPTPIRDATHGRCACGECRTGWHDAWATWRAGT